MTRTSLASAAMALALCAGAAQAQDIKIGVLLGFTGPIESLTPNMANAAELAIKEANESGAMLGGRKVVAVRADSTCVDAAAATAAAERLITAEGVVAIIGADCSGVTTAVANNVAIPKGVVMISPSATSPALTSIADNGYFFRTAPSDARQGEVLADVVTERGHKNVAISYTNNDYGKGLSESFAAAFTAKGGKVAISASHEDGKADYSAEIGALAASGAECLGVFGYLDQGGRGIIRAALDSGAFDCFFMGDGMIGESLPKAIGAELNGAFGTLPGSQSEGAMTFLRLAKGARFDGDGPYRGESYDAAALIILAIQAAKSTEPAAIRAKIMEIANGPGQKLMPGQIARGLEILGRRRGGAIDYDGATNVQFTPAGEAFGSYKEVEVKDGKFETISVR